MCAAVRAEDPGRPPGAVRNPGGTDAKAFTKLDIRCFGFKGPKPPHDPTTAGCSTASTNGCRWRGCGRFGVRVMTWLWQGC